MRGLMSGVVDTPGEGGGVVVILKWWTALIDNEKVGARDKQRDRRWLNKIIVYEGNSEVLFWVPLSVSHDTWNVQKAAKIVIDLPWIG